MLGAFQYFFVKEGVFWTSVKGIWIHGCLLYTSDAADERSSVDLGGRRIIKKKNKVECYRDGVTK